MSFMPDPGTVVRLKDGRIAAVSHFTPLGGDDRVIFSDSHEETISAWMIGEELTEAGAADPLDALRR
jgi:hypothetical protein